MTVDFQNGFVFIFLCFFTFFSCSLFFKKHKKLDLPPSPPSLPIIGHLHLLLSVFTHKSLHKLSSKYGSILYLRIFGFPIVLVSSASASYEIFKAHDANISSRGFPPINDSLLAGSYSFISSPYGDYWKFIKKLLVTKLLGPQALERSRSVREDELARFYNSLFDKAVKEESVEICEEVLNFTNNSICKMIMGRRCCCGGEVERVKELGTMLDGLVKKVLLANMLRAPFKKVVVWMFKKEMNVVSGRFNEVIEKFLVEHEKKQDGEDDMDFMDVMLNACRDENAEYKITRNHIKSVFADILFASTDTSVQAMQWTMAEIVNNPNILERLRGELDSVVGKTRLIQETDLPNLRYLQAVVKEGLRLHPPGPLFARFSRERCTMIGGGGFYVPEKTTLMVNAYAVMRDPSSWEDPNEFKPERFLLTSSSSRLRQKENGLKYIPFGSGRRGCPGENLAYVLIGTAIGMMVQGFEWRNKEEKVNMEEAVVELSLTMARPLKLTPIARTIKLLS
ncbi:unnamed protein product [Cochlearia groenlandica]